MIYFALLATTAIIFLSFFRKYRTSKNLPLPPGPKGWPLIGNLLDMPSQSEWITYHKWSKELGTDILYLNVAGTRIIVLDTIEAATDLLEKRSVIYSGRTRLIMCNELMGWDFAFGFMNYGETWRHRRRIVSEQFNTVAVQQFYPKLLTATRGLLKDMLQNSNDVIGNLRHLAADTIFSVVYGLDVKMEGRESLEAAKEANHAMLIAGIPGRFLVDYIPLLRFVPEWVPGAKFQKLARGWKEATLKMIEMPFLTSKAKVDDGTAATSVLAHSIAKMQEGANPAIFTHENIKAATGTIFTAGSDTTVSCLASCILALVHNPHVVAKAQKELDGALSVGQLPDFSDEDSLPYITAIVKETLRWRDVAPIAIPHRLDADDVYRGYHLPKGSMVIGNSWAILHDEKIYPDPFKFNPDRFIKDGKFDKSVPDPELSCFGFGRRICPGRHLAYSAVWIAVASLLTVFDIKKVADKDGRIIEPGEEYDSALVCTPLPFPCSITPRSEKWSAIIRGDSD
ncbi:hypothetical protein HYPSUDRAFT_202249 [Hypholoma sublateritium FD-334 SS-4]|uniref:Cytochrome P450 n=1 Tax=Hypholoma sublateritium (strain FD-334 SS-4) TaxID=945553 RepID=A0A0D2L5U7_HYPSF|nr:hypothetical protein HYPSUDRAFT_202249 [Hypholoma sublateritium FD-334 SS-4]